MTINNKGFIKTAAAAACIIILVLLLLLSAGKKSELPVITMSIWGSREEQELLEEMVQNFTEQYKDEAQFQITVCEESEGTCKDTVLLCPEAAADIFFFADDQLTPLKDAGALLAITDDKDVIMEECGGTDSVAIEAVSRDGEMYAYPSTASNGYFLYYNSKYYTENDVKSLDRMLDIAKENGKKFGMELTSGWYMYSFYKGAGMDVHINADGVTNTCDWNRTSGGLTGAQVTDKLIGIATHEGFANVSNDDFVAGIQSGDIIAGISGTWNANSIEEAFGDGYAACRLPCYNVDGQEVQMHSVAGYKLLGVNAHTAEPMWAQRLAKWLTNEENQLKRFAVRGEGPANRAAAQNEAVQQSIAIAALSEQMEYGHLQYVAGSYWDETFRLGNIIAAGNIEGVDTQDLLDDFVNKITTVQE